MKIYQYVGEADEEYGLEPGMKAFGQTDADGFWVLLFDLRLPGAHTAFLDDPDNWQLYTTRPCSLADAGFAKFKVVLLSTHAALTLRHAGASPMHGATGAEYRDAIRALPIEVSWSFLNHQLIPQLQAMYGMVHAEAVVNLELVVASDLSFVLGAFFRSLGADEPAGPYESTLSCLDGELTRLQMASTRQSDALLFRYWRLLSALEAAFNVNFNYFEAVP